MGSCPRCPCVSGLCPPAVRRAVQRPASPPTPASVGSQHFCCPAPRRADAGVPAPSQLGTRLSYHHLHNPCRHGQDLDLPALGGSGSRVRAVRACGAWPRPRCLRLRVTVAERNPRVCAFGHLRAKNGTPPLTNEGAMPRSRARSAIRRYRSPRSSQILGRIQGRWSWCCSYLPCRGGRHLDLPARWWLAGIHRLQEFGDRTLLLAHVVVKQGDDLALKLSE